MRLMVLCALLLVTACGKPPPARETGGDPVAGQLLIEQYGCGVCHEVPGVRTAVGSVGPALGKFARQVYIAGEFPNEPELLVRWIRDPQALIPETTMPNLGVNETHARDMSAYLYTLH